MHGSKLVHLVRFNCGLRRRSQILNRRLFTHVSSSKYIKNRNDWARVYGTRRQKPNQFTFLKEISGSSITIDLNRTVRRRNFFQDNKAIAGQAVPGPPQGADFPWEMTGASWAGRGDQFINTSNLTGSLGDSIRKWVNRVSPSSLYIEQTNGAFAPASVDYDSDLTSDSVEFGTNPTFDDWDECDPVDQFISNDEWHVFAVAYFADVTLANQGPGALIFGTARGVETTDPTNGIGLAVKTIAGSDYAIGYMSDGTTEFSVSASFTSASVSLIEFYGSASLMGVRVNAGAAVEGAFTGTIISASTDTFRVGSKTFAGKWGGPSNILFELSFANQKNTITTAVREYFSSYYSIAT